MYSFLLDIVPASFHGFLPFVFFVLALFLLVKSADWFVDAAEILGLKLGVPQFIIGITVIGIGTSLPELATSLATIFQEKDATEIISANIIGSNIANILLGVGIASFFRVVRVKRELQDNDLPFLFGSTAMAIYFLSDGLLSFGEGLILLTMFFVFLAFSLLSHEDDEEEVEKQKEAKGHSLFTLLVLLLVTGAMIIFSANMTITSLIEISPILGIEKDVASMVLLAVGTSFPEIFVSVMAVQKGKPSLALGNILGSNIGNILGILGVSAVIRPLVISEASIAVGIPFLIIATLFFIFSAMDNRFRIWEGLMAVGIFVAFLGELFDVI